MSKSKKASAVGTAASAASTDYTTVSLYDIDNRSPHECGYCKHNGSISIGIVSYLNYPDITTTCIFL